MKILADIPIEYRVSHRAKRASIKVKPSGVEVVIPNHMRSHRIEQWVQSKEAWIQKHWTNVANQPLPYCWVEGNMVLYQGNEYQFQILASDVLVPALQIQHSTIVLHVPKKTPNKRYEAYLQQAKTTQLRRHIMDMVDTYASAIGRVPQRIRLAKQKTRWGSCSATGTLSFNTALIYAPPWVLEYVVVHEMCHLVYPNHSKKFWQLVDDHYPKTKEAKAWLKTYGTRIS